MAYNRYQYETSPRKLQPEYEPIKEKKYNKKSTLKNKKSSKKQQKIKKAKHRKLILYLTIGFLLLLISQEYSEVKKLESKLASIEKENEQIEVNIETNLNLKNIEKSAQDMLGMQKVSDIQTIYVELPREDYVEPASEEIEISKENNWLSEIWNMILEYIK